MRTAWDIIRKRMADLKVSQEEFVAWCKDCDVPEEELDTTSRHLALIEQYARERADAQIEDLADE